MPIEHKPSKNEDEYFARMDAELIKAHRARLDAERAQRERASHLNRCPRCGAELREEARQAVKIDACPECGGMWLDKGELELLSRVEGKTSGLLGGFLRR